MNKINFDKTSQLRTRMAILESQLEVATHRADNYKMQNEQLAEVIRQLKSSQTASY
ncbi:MAG: hypothetical protein HOD16_05135 [Nitrospina sp.]|jgi:hypothetical protein|nr:hypothetical protein [Nitrospina sp.]